MSTPCACQSNQTYSQCCEPYHLGQKFPNDAAQLMRSRYCAYVMTLIEYVIDTTVPRQQNQLNIQLMREWSTSTAWAGLEIIHHLPKIDKRHAQVEFKAYFKRESDLDFHHELSTFVKIDQRWYFIDPTVDNYPTMKQPCFCGSGIKFKSCCGKYI